MKNILVTGGAGFVGSNLLNRLRHDYPEARIVSLDNYFTGTQDNHVPGVEYYHGHTADAHSIFEDLEVPFDTVFHFGEYSRIVQSFEDIKIAEDSILMGTPRILELCKEWGAKLIYSASSSKFGNGGRDENLAPYSWMKAKMVELIENYGNWFGLEYQINYFFNVYGPGQITTGDYATVVGIFERQYLNDEPCTVVSPGTQSRDFTHVDDIIEGVMKSAEYLHRAVEENHDSIEREWFLRSGVSRTIIEVAEMFGDWTFIPERKGERTHSAQIDGDTNERLGLNPQDRLQEWINFIKKKKAMKTELNLNSLTGDDGQLVSPTLNPGIKNYLIDIDGTITDDVPNEEPERMAVVQPFPDALETLNRWYDDGHVITFFTSRTEDHREVTEAWLNRHGFKYHGLLMGKPRGGNYHWIDNHIVRATRYTDKWTDLVEKEKVVEVFQD